MNNIDQNKNIYIDTGNNNSKTQINYKNINTTQTEKTLINHNKKYIQYIKPLLLLLQKAEQIISIINLPPSSIDKYNQLKEISFKKCGLEYTPLVKNNELIKNFQKENNKNNNNIEQNKNKENKIIYDLSLSKNKLLDLILSFIETNNFLYLNTNNSNNNNSKDNKSFLNNSNEFNINCSILKEEINTITTDKNINFNNQINDTQDLIYREKEKLLNYISRAQQNIISIFYENDKKFNELKDAFLLLNSKNEFLNKYINNIDELMSPIWNKYFNKDVDWFDPNKIIDNHELKTYTKSHFLLNFMNQLFTDNKNLMEAVTDMEKKKNEAYNILKMPYIRKVIEKSENLKNIENLLEKLKERKDKNKDTDINKLIKDGKELINCIKETIIEDPKNNDVILKKNNDENKDNDMVSNYNDDMNIFLGKLMNGIQNILNKVDISIKKDELIESMIKVNLSKNKNLTLDNSNINMNNTNMNINMSNTNLNMNNITNNGLISKDLSFISANNNNDINNSKLQNMSFQVYKKKTNHISGSNVIINNNKNEIDNNDKKNTYAYDVADTKKNDFKKKILNKIIDDNKNEKKYLNKNDNDINFNINNNDDIMNDNVIIKSINNIINDKNKDIDNDKFINNEETVNEEKSITIGDIGNNVSEQENSQKNKNINYSIDIKKNININNKLNEENKIVNDNQKNKEEDITDEGLEELKNMVLEDFKTRLNEEKEDDD